MFSSDFSIENPEAVLHSEEVKFDLILPRVEQDQHLELESDHGDLCDMLGTLVSISLVLPPGVDHHHVGGPRVSPPDLRAVVLHQSSEIQKIVILIYFDKTEISLMRMSG